MSEDQVDELLISMLTFEPIKVEEKHEVDTKGNVTTETPVKVGNDERR